MGCKCCYKNWMHMTLMILILFPLIDLIKHSDAHNQSAEFNTSNVVECLQMSNCGLSNQSRSIDITKNNTVPDDIIDDNTVAIEKDKNSTNTEDDIPNSSNSPIDLNDFSNILSDGIIESEIPESLQYDSFNDTEATTEDEFLSLLKYADLDTEQSTSVDTITDKNYLEDNILNTPPNIKHKEANSTIIESAPDDLNDSPANSNNTEPHSVISSIYMKHLNTSTAENITKELLKTKMNFEKILEEEESKNDVFDRGDANVTVPKKISPGRKGSLAFVFDATGSMWDDLVQLRRGAELILETMLEREDKPIQNYVLVPFRDPDVGPIEVSTDDTFLTERLENLSVYGGENCPEKSLSGITAALNVSLPYSFIYVFTDATADDYLMVDSVIDLVQKKHSQIVFVLTGDCKSRDKPGYKVYEQIAAASSGQVFRLKKHDVFNVVEFVKDSLDANRVNLGSSINPPGQHEHKLTIDDTLKKVTVSVAGNKPVITVTDPQGKNYEGPPKIIPILDLSDVKVVNIIDPEPGSWTLTVGSPQNHSVKVTGLSDLHFEYGFSVHPTEKMSETSNRPLSGAQNNLMISVNDDVEIDTLKSVELLNVNGETLYEVPLEELSKKPNEPYIFRTVPFLPPATLFYIAVNGVDLAGNSLRRISSTGVNPQLPEKPIMEVQEEVTGYIHSQVILQCKVQSMVPITVWWFKNGIPVMKKQEHVQTATVDYLIVNLDENSEGRYVCKASNMAGHSAASVNVILTTDPPKVELLPSNTSALSGKTMTLDCYVDSQMPATVQIDFQSKANANGSSKKKDVGELHKKFMGMSTVFSHEFIITGDTEGLYTCSATNKGGTSIAESMVNLLAPLKVDAFPKIIEFEKGGTLGFSCIIHGTTDGRWVALNNDIRESEDLDWDITRVKLATGGVQLFMDAKNPTKKHEGVYDCYGFRGDETAHDSVESRYVEAPSLVGNQESFSFELDSTAVVDCNVTGIPPPIVSWHQPDGSTIAVETEETKRVYVKGSELIIHNANPVDDGRYVCEAENQFGVAKRTVDLSVWEKPRLIQKLENKTINIYDSAMIPCKVAGVPIPLVAWYHENQKLMNIETTAEGSILVFNRIDVNNEGTYTCMAENKYGILKEDVYVQVTGLEMPIVTKGNKSIILKEGDNFQINCGYLRGKPLPSLYWQKDGGNISEVSQHLGADNSVDETDDANTNIELIMNSISHEQEGNYSCIGRNILGEDRYDFLLEVQRPPKFTRAEDYEDYQEGDAADTSVETTAGSEVTLNCEAVGKPKPFITWSKDGIPVVFTNIVYMNAGSDLVISGVRESDSGHYTCLASNPVGTNQKNFTVDVLVKPTILNERTDPVLQTIEGQMVVLPCSVYAVPAPQVTWLFNEEHILPSDRLQLDSENTLRFVANLTDSGVYQCQAINKAGNSSQEYLVLVFVPPYIYPTGNEVVKAKEGSYIALNCHAIGFPQPNIIWTKNGHALNNESSDIILNDSGLLNITRMTKNNSGTFICEAENYAGFSEKIFYVVMNEVPNILPSELPVNIQLLAGEDEFNIPCRASGNPPPYISWMKDGKYIINDLHTKVQADGTLSLRLVTEDLSGKYTCQAANTEGSIEIDYHIQVVAPPTLLDIDEHGKNIIALEGSTAILECPLRHSSVLPNVQWYKDSDLIDENENKTVLKLINVSRHDASQYSCLASNAGGKVLATFKLIVQWPPSFVNRSDEDSEHVHFLEGEPMKLACNVDANPAADVQWLRNLEMIGDISPVLRRNFVKTHHAGEHVCVASNPHGQIKKNFIVDVSAPPTIDGPESVDMAVRLGQPIKLDCFAKGFPKPDIEWAVKYAPDWDVIGDGRVLKAFNISKHSEGVYSCVAKNKVGSASKQFNISVTEPPRVPTVKVNVSGKQESPDSMGNISLKVGSNVSLSCVSYGDSPSSVMWIRNGVVLNDSESLNTTNIYFENLQPRDSGKYTCLSKNNIGSEEYDIDIDVLVLPEILNDGSIEVRLGNHNKTKSKWRTLETLERQSIKLRCHAQGNPVPDIYWFKDKNYMGFYDSNVMTQDQGQVLFIKRVSRVHAGNYTCVARNKVGEDKLNFKVDVWVSPYVEQQKEEGGVSFVAKSGHNVHLECPVTSNPKPAIRWLKHPYFDIDSANFPHIQTKDDNSTLIINNVTVADNGNYSCIGTNIVGMMEMLFTVEVVETPTILDEEPDEKKSYMYPNGTVIAKIRRGFQLACNAVAQPEPEINWYKDGFRLYNSFGADSLHISRDGRYLNVVDASLSSAGKYVCNAHNKVGEIEKEFFVKILVPAEWGPWTPWSECSTACGSGQSTRKRECQFHGDLEAIHGFSSRHTQHVDKGSNNGSTANQPISGEQKLKVTERRSSVENTEHSSSKSNKKLSEDLLDKSACRGNETEVRECFIVPCKVDGGWSAWGEWTSCSVRCGPGSRRRYRSCSAPHPQHGGAACVGADAQQEPCEGVNCSLWSYWSSWSECSVTCGKGVQMRSRRCDGPADSCLGQDRESRICLLPSCPVRGAWGSWSEWSPCSVTCGTGHRKRGRECRGGGCTGGNLQIEKCLDIRNSCNKYVGGINDAYGRKKHNKALLNISGKLNGFNLPSKFVEADIFEKNGRQYVQTSINDVLSKKDDYLPFMSFMISPTTLDDADKDKAYPNKPLASSRLRMMPSVHDDTDSDESDDSQIQFATGEQVHLYHRNQGISKSGEVMVDIIIDGNIPADYNNNDDDAPAMLIADSVDPYAITELRVNTCSKGYSYSEGTNECKDVNECELPINSCHSTQMCENLPGSYRCLCQHGYMSMGIGQRCLDVNECLQHTDGCSHDCVNTAGNFYCTCPKGLHLTSDKKTCVKDDIIEDITEWLKGFGVTEKPTATTNTPVKKIEIIEESPDSSEDGENILLTRISPKRDKSKPYQRKLRPHKHNVKDDYDYGVLSPFDKDVDYYEGKGRSRISKQSNWSQPIIAAITDDEKDIYDLQEKKKNETELKNAQLNLKLSSFFNFINTDKTLEQNQNNDSHEDSTTTTEVTTQPGVNYKKENFPSILKQKEKNILENYDDDDDSYEDEDSYAKLFEDSCPEGFYFDNNKCHDIDECAMNMNSCNGVINMCINTRGSYACVPTPCPELYQRSSNGTCEQRCDVRDSACSEGAALRQSLVYIIFSTSVYETPVPGTILNLRYGGKQNNTKYTLQRQPKGETFYVTTEDKMGTLRTLMVPSLKHINRIIINSKGSDEKGTKLLYYTKFIVYLYIWE